MIHTILKALNLRPTFCGRLITLSLLLSLTAAYASAQQYAGMTGLIHLPSAEMDSVGDARIGAHFLNRYFTPEGISFHGKKYHTYDFYLSLTPFWWVEAAFVMTLEKGQGGGEHADDNKLLQKDRHFSVKLNPLREGKYYPAVALGYQDFSYSSSKNDMGINYFRNYYLALTKNVNLRGSQLGATLVYRHYTKHYNHRWNGLVGGVTFRPAFARNWRAILEWTGNDVNFGIDCLLWKHLLLQASLQDGRYPSAGICYKVNLF